MQRLEDVPHLLELQQVLLRLYGSWGPGGLPQIVPEHPYIVLLESGEFCRCIAGPSDPATANTLVRARAAVSASSS